MRKQPQGERKKKRITGNAHYKLKLSIALACLFFYGISWKLPAMVDWYRLYLFPFTTNTLSRLMSLFPFSVGELLIYAGVFLLAGSIPVFFLGCLKNGFIKKIRRFYFSLLSWAFLWVLFTETFHCFVMYHATTVEEEFFDDFDDRTYGREALAEVYELLVGKSNALSEKMTRDPQGQVIYDGNMEQDCIFAMQKLGEAYPYLSGYYPNPKKIRSSDFMSQQYLSGIFFPFTLEANYNTTMYIMNKPATICHELSHLKGIILEDEANYFGFLACISSGNEFLAYSGYLSVLPYVTKEIRDSFSREERTDFTQPNVMVQKDAVFLTGKAWEKVEKKAVISTQTINQATDTFLEGNLRANGVKDGIKSYSRVVRLLLDFYADRVEL